MTANAIAPVLLLKNPADSRWAFDWSARRVPADASNGVLPASRAMVCCRDTWVVFGFGAGVFPLAAAGRGKSVAVIASTTARAMGTRHRLDLSVTGCAPLESKGLTPGARSMHTRLPRGSIQNRAFCGAFSVCCRYQGWYH